MLLGAAALVFLALRAGNLSSFSFAPTYTLTASFDNVGGLEGRARRSRAPAWWWSRVSRHPLRQPELPGHGHARPRSAYQFPKDSSASILTSGLLGEQYVGLPTPRR